MKLTYTVIGIALLLIVVTIIFRKECIPNNTSKNGIIMVKGKTKIKEFENNNFDRKINSISASYKKDIHKSVNEKYNFVDKANIVCQNTKCELRLQVNDLASTKENDISALIKEGLSHQIRGCGFLPVGEMKIINIEGDTAFIIRKMVQIGESKCF